MTARRFIVTTAAVPVGIVVLLAIALFVAARPRKPSPEQVRGWKIELERLQVEQDSLRARSAELVAKDPRILGLPHGEVVAAVPTAFVRSVMNHLFRDVVDNVTLSLSGIKAHAAKKVKKVVTIGEFVVDVDITKVVAKLRPRQPAIAFGGDSISLSLPITVAEGQGEAMVHFVWDGKNVADLTCGDMDVTQKVTGNVIPADYTVTGALALATQGRRLTGTFRFPETRIRLRVKPSKESWDAINALLEEKKGVCGWVLDKVNVPKILTNLAEEKGFSVKLPVDKIRPIVFTAGIQDSVTVGEHTLAISAQTNTIRIDADAIWIGADVRLKEADQ